MNEKRRFDHRNKGTGLEIARQLAQELHGAARDLTRGTEATETLKELETFERSRSTMLTITHAAKTIEAEFGRLDILVNNAGIADSADGLPARRT